MTTNMHQKLIEESARTHSSGYTSRNTLELEQPIQPVRLLLQQSNAQFWNSSPIVVLTPEFVVQQRVTQRSNPQRSHMDHP
jgi:hypothetical protein